MIIPEDLASTPPPAVSRSGLARLRSRAGLSIKEIVIALAVLAVLVAVLVPVVNYFRQKSHQATALERVKALAGGLATYASANGGLLPNEDAEGNDNWSTIGSPAAKDAWYNVIPAAIGKRPVGELGPAEFYSDANITYLPGADYSDEKKMESPFFAIAYNTKLERRDANGKKERIKLDQITDRARTVAFLEQGMPDEERTLEIQTKTDYDGAPKGSAKSFIGRYGGKGVLGFMDGHAELVPAEGMLTNTGKFPFPPDRVIWTVSPSDDPNKTAEEKERKKKK